MLLIFEREECEGFDARGHLHWLI